MLGSGLVVAVAAQLALKALFGAPSFAAEISAHLSAIGVAVALVGGLCLISASKVVSIILYPLGSVGMMPLTIYTGHVLILALRYALDPTQPVKDQTVWILLTLGSLVFATLWRLLLGQGPLERALRALDGSRQKNVRPTGIEPMTSTV
ncbi:DUF418 domain-containing protein [Subtercola boreus]